MGFAELIPDVELALHFSNGHTGRFKFRGRCKVLEIGKMISRYCLEMD